MYKHKIPSTCPKSNTKDIYNIYTQSTYSFKNPGICVKDYDPGYILLVYIYLENN